MLVVLATALALEPTPDTVVGTVPMTGVTARQVEVPLSEGTRYHFTRLTAELAPHQARYFEPGLKLRGTYTAFSVLEEGRSTAGISRPSAELWLTAHPRPDLVLSTFVGYAGPAPTTTWAYHVVPYETATNLGGPWVGTHAAFAVGSLELQQTLVGQPGFFSPGSAASVSNVAWRQDRVQLMGSFIVTPWELHLGPTVRAQPVPWVDVGLALNVPLRSIPEDKTVPLDVVVDLRIERPREAEVQPRQILPRLRDGVQF